MFHLLCDIYRTAHRLNPDYTWLSGPLPLDPSNTIPEPSSNEKRVKSSSVPNEPMIRYMAAALSTDKPDLHPHS